MRDLMTLIADGFRLVGTIFDEETPSWARVLGAVVLILLAFVLCFLFFALTNSTFAAVTLGIG